MVLLLFACFSFLEVLFAVFEQCKRGHYFAWAGINPGIKSPVEEEVHILCVHYRRSDIRNAFDRIHNNNVIIRTGE